MDNVNRNINIFNLKINIIDVYIKYFNNSPKGTQKFVHHSLIIVFKPTNIYNRY